MPTRNDIISGLLLPGLISIVVLILAWRPWRRSERPRGAWGSALALSCGFAAAYLGLFGAPSWPPAEKWQWIVHLALASGVVGLLDSTHMLRGRGRIVIGLLLAAAALALFHIPAGVENPWPWRAGLAVIVLAMWSAMEPLAQRRPGASLPLVCWATISASAALFALAGSINFAQLGGALAATLGAAAILTFWNGRISLAHGAMSVFCVVYPALLMLSRIWSLGDPDVPDMAYMLAVVAPLGAWIGEFPAVIRMKPGVAVLIRLAAAGIPAAAALAMALKTAPL